MKRAYILLFILALTSFTSSTEVSEEMKCKMFCKAFQNDHGYSSFDFTVIKVKNKKTGEVKEICTTTNFIEGALDYEGKSSFQIDCKKYPNRYFEFSNDNALRNVSFDIYSTKRLIAFSKTVNVDSIVQEVKKGKMKNIYIESDDPYVYNYFAHLMFNRGIITHDRDLGEPTLSYFVK